MKNMDKLLFRRQFIMGPKESGNFAGWRKTRIGGRFFLYSHPELDIGCLKAGEKEVYLLGYMLDPFNPGFNNERILEEIMRKCESFDDVLAFTDRYGGRWALIWKDETGIKMMNDACGTRQVYYYSGKHGIWCGSQPSIIAFELGLETSLTPELEEFIGSPGYKKECAWIGDGTIYKNVRHLLPNHYLDLELPEVRRFWPVKELCGSEPDNAVKETAGIMRGMIAGILNRFGNVMLSVTAGVDSRMNLAASRPYSGRIRYIFCRDAGNRCSTDYTVSSKLLERLRLKQHIIGLHEADKAFTDIYGRNVTMASDLPSKAFIYSFHKELPGYIHVSGVGAGIAKSFYSYDNSRISAGKICKAAGYENSAYVLSFVEKWLKDAESVKSLKTVNLYDLFYWEQRMGNWGAKSSAEQDIAVEETWPYNNRRLLATMLSVDAKYRKPPFYRFHRRVIRYLWEETLCMPVNPNFRKKAYQFVKNYVIR
ncbi:MAG TPA: hypothetical protein VHT96_07720 [Clostridia bacterium]|nr:hypothetical protein [Clostridia bacterium]